MLAKEFYIDYQRNAPRGIHTRVRLAVLAIFVLATAGALLFAASQRNFAGSNFDFAKPAEFTGTLIQQPFPSLRLEDPANPGSLARLHLLCAPGKHGADSLVEGWPRKDVPKRHANPPLYSSLRSLSR